MKNDKLVLRNSGQIQPTQPSLTACEIVLAREMAISAANSKTTLTPELTTELFRILGNYPAETVEWAFRTHRAVSDFWPSIRQITELCEECEERKRHEEKANLNAWTPEGLKVWRDLLEKFSDICKMAPPKKYRADHVVKNTRETLKAQAESLRK